MHAVIKLSLSMSCENLNARERPERSGNRGDNRWRGLAAVGGTQAKPRIAHLLVMDLRVVDRHVETEVLH